MLISGATGFLGHYLVEEFIHDYDIICIVRPGSRNLVRLKSLIDKIKIIEHDIHHDYNRLLDQVKDVRIILHAAGDPSAQSSLENPINTVLSNVLGTLQLLELSRRLQLERFVFYSAGEVFGAIPPGTHSRENDAYRSLTAYSASKAGAEELCLSYNNSYDIPVSILHVTNTFGPRSQANRFPVIAIKKILRQEPLIIHTDSNGHISGRKWLYAPLVAKQTRLILNSQKSNCEKWNSTGHKFISNLEFAQNIADILNILPLFQFQIAVRPGYDNYLSMSDDKLLQHGWHSDLYSFHENLKLTAEWYRKNPEWLERF